MRYNLLASLLILSVFSGRMSAQNSNPFHQAMGIHNHVMPKPEISENMPSALSSLLAKATEDTTKRTTFSSTYLTPDGQYVALYSKQMINYPNSSGNLVPVKIQLRSCDKGWVASQQPHPCYFHLDRSTGISLGNGSEFIFNANSQVNGVEYPQQLKSVSKDEVKIDMSEDIHKNIRFLTNGIETDYTIDKSIGASLEVSENIQFPEGCVLRPDKEAGGRMVKGMWQGNYKLVSTSGEEITELQAPLCYDATGTNWCMGYYRDEVKDGKHVLHTIVPDAWLSKATYPVTIDPVVIGPRTWWPQSRHIASDSWPKFNKDSILVTIPGKITITHLYVSYSFRTNYNHSVPYKYGRIYFKTPCTTTSLLSCDSSNLPGYCYVDTLANKNDFGPNSPYFGASLTCCFNPSCSVQHFYFLVGLSRDCPPSSPCLPSGLDSTSFIWTDTYPDVPFWAYIVGNTVEVNSWAVTPTTVCSNQCNINLNINAHYGVPPYTATHPWAAGKTVFGDDGNPPVTCNLSTGIVNIPLTLPNCPTFCGNKVDTLSVPPPVVYDVCGDTVKGLVPKMIIINPSPKITTDTQHICSGELININLSSCVPGSVFTWKGSDKTSGSTSTINYPGIDTSLTSSDSVRYTAICSFNGCADTSHPLVIVSPNFTLAVTPASRDTTIDATNYVILSASGGTSYSWAPVFGLSCPTCPTTTATPTVTTTYTVTVTNPEGCTHTDTIRVNVRPQNIIIPNIFTPNGDGKNDLFVIQNLDYYPESKLDIFNRWGEKVFSTGNYHNDWNGGGQSDGIYYYILTLTNGKKYHGYLELLK